MSLVAERGTGYSATAPSEGQLLLREKRAPRNGTLPGVACLHGHGGDCTQYAPDGIGSFGPGAHAWALADSGLFLLGATDDAGQTAWFDVAGMARQDDTFTWLTAAAQGAKTTKVGLMGWSMGGGGALNWIKRNPTKVACAWLWAPVTDLDWANNTAAYTPAYSTGGVTAPAGWGTEIQADFNPYATASNGYRIRDEYASWRGLGIPITVCHAQDDTTVPYAQSQAFVTGVNDPNVKLRTVATGGHTGVMQGVPFSEVIDFFKAASY